MMKVKTAGILVKEMVLQVVAPNVLTLRPYDRVHTCTNEMGEEFLLNILSFEWNADKTEAEIHAFLCNEAGENIKKEASYLFRYNRENASMVVEKIYP